MFSVDSDPGQIQHNNRPGNSNSNNTTGFGSLGGGAGGTAPPFSSPAYDLQSTLTSSASILNHGTEFSGAASSTSQHHDMDSSTASVLVPGHPPVSYDHGDFEYKSEPPSTPTYSQQDPSTGMGYTTSYTPSPSSRGSESPQHTPQETYVNFFNCSVSGSSLQEGGQDSRLSIAGSSGGVAGPYPVPTPPLSASHHTKETEMVLPDTNVLLEGAECPFTDEQKGCICDTLQNSNEIDKLGKVSKIQYNTKYISE